MKCKLPIAVGNEHYIPSQCIAITPPLHSVTTMTKRVSTKSPRQTSLVELLLVSAFVGALIYFSYFALSPFIWSQGEQFPIKNFTPWTRIYAAERDGIEVYALYSAVFLQGALLIGLTQALKSISNKYLLLFIALLLIGLSTKYFQSIGIHPPMSDYSAMTWSAEIQHLYGVLPGLALVGIYFYIVRNHSALTIVAAGIFLIPVCFIPSGPVYLPDYGYIFAPALRLLNNISVSKIYFQYDLFLSLIAALTLQSNYPIEILQIVGQFAFYALFFGIFVFSKQLFIDKRLCTPLLICIVLVRVYSGDHNILANSSFQVTPLRLDLWFILLLSVHFYGPSHWFTGVTLSFLIFFHRNFGIIYCAAYLQLIAITLYFEFQDSTSFIDSKYLRLRRFGFQYLLKYKINLFLTFVALACATIFLGGNGAYRYQNIGVGFLRITSTSFFWYVALLLTTAFALLIYLRNCISRQYFTSACFLIFLATGNSLYFFGRSHENNIINISVIYVFILFLFFDLIQIPQLQIGNDKGRKYKNTAMIGAYGIILLVCIVYANCIDSKIMRQFLNISSGQFVYANPFSKSVMEANIDSIRTVTGTSQKVYFVSHIDYLFYHNGNYKPIGYYTPFRSWLFQDEMISFINDLIQRDYYIVIDDADMIEEAIPSLKFSNSVSNGKYSVLWK